MTEFNTKSVDTDVNEAKDSITKADNNVVETEANSEMDNATNKEGDFV